MNMPTAGTTPTGPLGHVADRAHDAVDRAANSAAPIIERATGAAHRTIDRAADVATPAADWVSGSGKQLATRSQEFVNAIGGYVRERPLTSLATAVALAYLAGKLTHSLNGRGDAR